MNKQSITSNIIPSVGMGITIHQYSDNKVGTIIQITNKRIVIQMDKAIRVDKNGVSELQEYTFEIDSSGDILIATLRKDGRYRITKTNQLITLNLRQGYYDYSF